MVKPVVMDICIFHFLLIWYDRAWPFISKKYNFFLWTSFFLQILDVKTWEIKTTSHKICWHNHFLQRFSHTPAFYQCWWIWKSHQDQAADRLLSHNIDVGEVEGILMELSLSFLRKNLKKLWSMELSHNFCNWL